MKKTVFLAAFALPLVTFAPALGQDRLTLDAAIARAFEISPRLGAAAASVRASLGGERQAALRPNPEFAIDLENFAGRGEYHGLRAAETTVGVTQTIELGGKRAARRGLAAGERRLAETGYERARRDLRREVTEAYVELLAADERVRLAQEQQALAAAVAASVRRYVQAARDPLLAQSRADLALETAGLALAQAERDRDRARRLLDQLTEADVMASDLDRRVLLDRRPPPDMAATRARLADLPDLAPHGAEIARGRAAMVLEKARAVPDPQVTLGVRDFADSGAPAFVMGVAVPLPIFDRNQGGIERARHDILRAEEARREAERELMRQVLDARADWVAADADRHMLETRVLPQAEQAVALARTGYERGLFDHLQLLDTQRALQDARRELLDSMKRARLAQAAFDRLTGPEMAE